MLYVKAANEGKMKIHGGGYPDENIEPTCISDLPDDLQPHMWRMHDVLSKQLEKKQFWLIDEDTLEKIGSCIGDMMVEKIKEMAREYEEWKIIPKEGAIKHYGAYRNQGNRLETVSQPNR